MKKSDVVVGGVYMARVSKVMREVQVTEIKDPPQRYNKVRHRTPTVYTAVNLATGREITFFSASRLRSRVR